MCPEPHVKAGNTTRVVLFTTWCLALYLAFQSGPGGVISKLSKSIADVHAKDGVAFLLAPLAALVLTGLVSSENKARLIFWRMTHALPGHRAFSVLAEGDSRIDVARLRALVSPWPNTPRDENTTWYRLYRQCAELPPVMDAHRAFLLTRDMATISFLLAILAPWGLIIVQGAPWWGFAFGGAMLAQYLVLMVVTRNHGNRFVCTVLAEYVARSGSSTSAY